MVSLHSCPSTELTDILYYRPNLDLDNYDKSMDFRYVGPAITSPFNVDLPVSPPPFSSGNTSKISGSDDEIPLQTLKIL